MKGEKGKPLVMRNSDRKWIDGLNDMINYISKFMDVSKQTIIEIGSYQGESTEIFAKYFKKVIAIDPWQNGYDDNDIASFHCDMSIVEKAFDDRLAEYINIEKQKMKSSDYCNQLPNKSVAIVYIDGDHSYDGCKKDLLAWKEKIIDGGFLCGHDYYKGRKNHDVTKAVNEIKTPDATFKDTSWVIKL